MASAGNPNQPPATAFDMNNFFRPSHGPNPNPSPAAPQPPFPHAGPYSYPPQTGPVFHPYLHYPSPDPAVPRPVSYPAPPPGPAPAANPTPGARLMALLGTSSSPNLDHATSAPPPPVEYSVPPPNAPILPAPIPSAPPVPPQPSPSRLPSSKLPKGRHLHGDHAVYDIDDRQPGELQPQLEVTPITKYGSDPGLVIGRQIAVNRTYICYGLKLGAIRILNINTALRSLLRGHTQRVTDMAFFADDVHLLASASVDGRVYVWKINEGPDEEDKPQITGKVIVAIQIVSNGETFHPRVCWHSHKQEILVVGIENHVLKIDTTKVGKGEIISAEEPIKCHIDKLIDGVQLVGKHEGEVTDLSICQWMTSRLASASADGTVIIWEERKAVPLVTLRPHDGQPVNSAMFLTSPHRPDHIVLITAGHLNREVKLWASSSEEGWLLPSDAESWKCIQTLELKSSADSRLEDAFFNQVVVLPRADLILLANAKKNAIYAVHIDYGSCPVATHMDYLAEFTVTMPILSLTGTSDCTSEGLHIVQVYCVQTQAIQQYALNLSQCLPSPLDPELELNHFLNGSQELLNPLGLHHESSKLPAEMSAAPRLHVTASSGGQEYPSVEVAAISVESKQPSATIDVDSVHMGSSTPLPLSPRLSGRLSGIQTPSNAFEQSQPLSEPSILERRVDAIHTNVSDVTSLDDSSRGGETKVGQNDVSVVPSSPITFRHPTHLVTPSEILSASASSERKDVQETIVNKDVESVEVEVKVVGEAGASLPGTDAVYEEKEKPIYTQVPSSDAAVTRECCALPSDIVSLEGSCQPEDVGVSFEAYESPSIAPLEGQESGKEIEGKISESSLQAESSQSALAVKGKKQKVKAIPTSGLSPPCPTDLTTDPGLCSSPSMETAFSQLLAMQETLNQVVTMQKEMQKQMSAMVAVPVNKEGRRLETALGRSMEKAVKANVDAMWARLQEENAKHEKLERDRAQQITTSITNSMNKDLPAIVEKLVKRELSTVVPNITRSITTVLEKTISSAIADSFQKGVSDKAVAQLEKSVSSKLEATVARQVQAQFQTSGKQALQEALRVSLESSVIPAFEMSCKAMFEQVDATFRKGMTEHTTSSQQQFESAHSSLATTLRDALSSATTMTQTLTGELADGQRKFLALVAAGANQKAANPLTTQSSNGALAGLNDMAIFPQVEAPLDPTKELQRLISERKFGDAFTVALQRSDVSIVSWLCAQVDLQGLLAAVPSQLGQGVILSLLQQLACDLGNDTARKLEWMRDVAIAINPVDATIAIHVRPIFDQVYQILAHHQRTHPTITPAEANSLRVLMHVINSVLLSCK